MQNSSSVMSKTAFIVVCDVDSTLIDQEVIDELAALIGVGNQVAEITEAAMAGKLDFAQSLRARVALLAGLPLISFQEVRSRLNFTQGAKELVTAVHAAQGKIFAVSGGFFEVLDGLGAELKLDGWLANRLEVDADGLLTGNVSGEIVDAEVKAEALRSWAIQENVPLNRTLAVGDGANDSQLVQTAGLGIAFDAKEALRALADVSVPVRDLAQVIAFLPTNGGPGE